MSPVDHPRIGVAGVGALGFHHARILAGLEGVTMAGVHDLRGAERAEVGSQLGVPVHDTWRASWRPRTPWSWPYPPRTTRRWRSRRCAGAGP